MARPLSIEFEGAIYHVMARGNGGQRLFQCDDDYRRLLRGLEQTVGRTGWEVFAFVWMPNRINLCFRTPRPNLSPGMQYLLSGYARKTARLDWIRYDWLHEGWQGEMGDSDAGAARALEASNSLRSELEQIERRLPKAR